MSAAGRSGTGAGGVRGGEAPVQQIAFLSALIAIWACWPLVHTRIPIADRFAIADLIREHWAHRHRLEPWLDLRWAWLAVRHYHFWFALATLPGVIAVALVQSVDRRTGWPILYGPLGWIGGGAVGYMLFANFRADSWPLAVMMPATFAFLGGAIGARLGAWPRKITHLRGTGCGCSPAGAAVDCARG